MIRPRLPLVTRREFDRVTGDLDAAARQAGDRAEALSAALQAAFAVAGVQTAAPTGAARPTLTLVRGGQS